MTMINPTTAVPPPHQHHQNLSKQHHCFYAGRAGLINRLKGYGCSSEGGANHLTTTADSKDHHHHNHLVLVVGRMADDDHQEDESRTTESANEATTTASTSLMDADAVFTDKSQNQCQQEDTHHNTDKGDDKWLQLRIGGGSTDHNNNNNHQRDMNHRAIRANDDDPKNSARVGLVELDLLPPRTAATSALEHDEFRSSLALAPPGSVVTPPRPPPTSSSTCSSSSNYYYGSNTEALFMQQYHPGSISCFPYHPDFDNYWGAFRPNIHHHQRNMNMDMNMNVMSANSSTPLPLPACSSSRIVPPAAAAGPYFSRPSFLFHGAGLGLGLPRPDIDFRVTDPPRRPASGIWFMLQASHHQSKEPFLPQISKSFLRIKDGTMTIRIVMKYLISKLNLESESEVEIKCRGQQIQPMLTLEHVRDSIWSRRGNVVHLLPDSSPTPDHIMVLNYGRSL